ncbi:hypothetical protein E4U09_005672 [Claviceps aff. purpurea]|uniref:Threonine/serine exporter-like N-terminal domain-containing protein n=1 Tax=Claviceps aff. purpurea TaxID=1967640 RepID=A0A9P7QGD7_9HYPO|nr:hypothetical protein E4U09_005672 [Claviceps aff. purpurea]
MAGIIARREYLVKLCRAIIMYGALKHQLEEYMSMSSLSLEIEGHFDHSTTHTAEVKLARVLQGKNLGKLQDVHDISVDVAHDRLGVEEAARRLDTVLDRRPKFQVRFLVLTYGLASASGDVYKSTFDLEGARTWTCTLVAGVSQRRT